MYRRARPPDDQRVVAQAIAALAVRHHAMFGEVPPVFLREVAKRRQDVLEVTLMSVVKRSVLTEQYTPLTANPHKIETFG